MLSKLFKNEWISTWKVPTALCIYLAALTILGCVSFLSPFWGINSPIIEIIAAFSVLIYVLSIFSICIASTIYFIVRFYRNMYTDEGYLMHTLPVRSWQHVTAKGLTFLIWSILIGLAVVSSILTLATTATLSLSQITIADLKMLGFDFQSLMAFFKSHVGISFLQAVLMLIALFLVQAISGILIVYASVSIGQLFTKHRVLASFLAYACINMVLQFITSLVQIPSLLARSELFQSSAGVLADLLNPAYFSSLIQALVLSVAAFIATCYIMNRKLNLE